jgi:membrane protein involved in colicin uptake
MISAFFAFLLLSIGGCGTSSPIMNSSGNYQTKSRIWTQNFYDSAKRNTYADAQNVCSKMNRSVEALRAGDTYDSIGWIYLLEFTCYDPVERARIAANEAERKRAIKAEQDRIAAIERQREEAERMRQQAEWERARPEREAAERAAQERERSRLNGICPIYYIARQTCASSGNGYEQCMSIRIGKNYSSWDDRTCFNR